MFASFSREIHFSLGHEFLLYSYLILCLGGIERFQSHFQFVYEMEVLSFVIPEHFTVCSFIRFISF